MPRFVQFYVGLYGSVLVDDLCGGPMWRQLYVLAVLETNPMLVKQRVWEAQWAVTARLDELERRVDSGEEKDALIRTSYALVRLEETEWVV
jgi:hypothetical protein